MDWVDSVAAFPVAAALRAVGKEIWMICPRCQKLTLKQKHVRKKNLTVDYCPKCKGIWFDRAELARATPVAEVELEVPRNAVRLNAQCPVCAKPLYAFHYPHTRVTVEACKKCAGLWLNAGEFDEIRKARENLPESIESEEQAEVGGVKGALIRLIDSAIENLMY